VTASLALMERTGHVHEATVRLDVGTDPAAVGAAVTVELCGAVDHAGTCRWPHNNEISADGERFRTVFVAAEPEVDEVHRRTALALRSATGWSVASNGARDLTTGERELAARLVLG
jgi:hypothetical protein